MLDQRDRPYFSGPILHVILGRRNGSVALAKRPSSTMSAVLRPMKWVGHCWRQLEHRRW